MRREKNRDTVQRKISCVIYFFFVAEVIKKEKENACLHMFGRMVHGQKRREENLARSRLSYATEYVYADKPVSGVSLVVILSVP